MQKPKQLITAAPGLERARGGVKLEAAFRNMRNNEGGEGVSVRGGSDTLSVSPNRPLMSPN